MTPIFEPYKNTKKHFAKHGLIIRPSEDNDFENLVKLKLLSYEELDKAVYRWYLKHPEYSKKEFFGFSGQDPEKRVFYIILNLKNEVSGSGGIIQHKPKKQLNVGHLSDILIAPEYRGMGLGKILLKDLIGKAKLLNFNSLYLTTRIKFVAARNLYKKFGFVKAKKQEFASKNSVSLELELN